MLSSHSARPLTSEESQWLMPDEPTRFLPIHINPMLTHCERYKASDIVIQTNYPILVDVNGHLNPITKRRLSNTEVSSILNEIYGANGTTQIASGEDIDTHYDFKPERFLRYRYRVNATGCLVEGHDGIQITLRTIPTVPPVLKDLDIPSSIMASIMPRNGIIYITGSTGSGKSTLLAAIMRALLERDDSHQKIVTYESPIEFVYDEIETSHAVISQSEIPRHIKSFSLGVRNALRRKPTAILVGEARDAETMTAVLEAAMTGHPVYTTLHTNGVPETIRRLVHAYPSNERDGRTIDIIETTRLIVSQRLVRSTQGGRIALREYLVFDENIRDQLLNQDMSQVTQNVRNLMRDHGQSMANAAQKKFEEGLITERDYRYLSKASE